MFLKRKNLIICSMILLLFVIGYAYNTFTTTELNNTSSESMADESGIMQDANVSIEENNQINLTSADNREQIALEPSNTQNGSVEVVSGANNEAAASAVSASFFSEYRMEREKNRSKEVEMWQNIINSTTSEKTFKTLAQQELVKIVAMNEKEMMIEQLIISRGFNDALVFITDDNATVIVDAKELTQDNVARIQDIVSSKAKINPANIKIMKKN